MLRRSVWLAAGEDSIASDGTQSEKSIDSFVDDVRSSHSRNLTFPYSSCESGEAPSACQYDG